jgi:hypothetical protein
VGVLSATQVAAGEDDRRGDLCSSSLRCCVPTFSDQQIARQARHIDADQHTGPQEDTSVSGEKPPFIGFLSGSVAPGFDLDREKRVGKTQQNQ